MRTIIRRVHIFTGKAELEPDEPAAPRRRGTEATIILYRAPREAGGRPEQLVDLLRQEGFKTGTLQTRNPPSPDNDWSIPIIGVVKASVPYVVALAAVLRAWFKERKDRHLTFRIGSLEFTAKTEIGLERMLSKVVKHADKLSLLTVTKKSAKPARKRRVK